MTWEREPVAILAMITVLSTVVLIVWVDTSEATLAAIVALIQATIALWQRSLVTPVADPKL